MYKTSAPSSSHTFLTQYRTVADGLIIGALCVLLEGCVTPVTQVRDGQATAPAVNPEAGIFPADPALAMPDPGSEASAAAVGGSPTDSPPDGNPPGPDDLNHKLITVHFDHAKARSENYQDPNKFVVLLEEKTATQVGICYSHL